MLNPQQVQIRDLKLSDVDQLVRYWYDSPKEFWSDRGVDVKKLSPRNSFKNGLVKILGEQGHVNHVAIIEFDREPIGVHSLTDLVEKDHAVFHAHIFDEKHRCLGIGPISYVKAADFFFKKLGLKKLYFKTPIINSGAIKIKQKLGLECLGNCTFESPILIKPLPAKLYQIDQAWLSKQKASLGI